MKDMLRIYENNPSGLTTNYLEMKIKEACPYGRVLYYPLIFSGPSFVQFSVPRLEAR